MVTKSERKIRPLIHRTGARSVPALALIFVVLMVPFFAQSQTGKGVASKSLPLMVDLGANQCVPCKLMAPILEGLRKEYAGRVRIEFIDVWKNPTEGRKYRVHAIPTQIFYDSSGKELYRHMGFMSKEDIVDTFRELGFIPKETPKGRK